MLATANVPHFLYGFCNMAEDSLVLSGANDIYSSSLGFVSKAERNEKYYTPDEQINKTKVKWHNEMDFARFQNGQRKQPDYIMAFREHGEIARSGEVLYAYYDWEEKIPIVVVDVEKCLESEREKVEEMLNDYQKSKKMELGKQIVQKVENNRKKATTEGFCRDLQSKINSIKDDIKETKIEEKEGKVGNATLQKNFDMVTAKERKEKMTDLRWLHAKIQEMMKEKEEDYEQIGK